MNNPPHPVFPLKTSYYQKIIQKRTKKYDQISDESLIMKKKRKKKKRRKPFLGIRKFAKVRFKVIFIGTKQNQILKAAPFLLELWHYRLNLGPQKHPNPSALGSRGIAVTSKQVNKFTREQGTIEFRKPIESKGTYSYLFTTYLCWASSHNHIGETTPDKWIFNIFQRPIRC